MPNAILFVIEGKSAALLDAVTFDLIHDAMTDALRRTLENAACYAYVCALNISQEYLRVWTYQTGKLIAQRDYNLPSPGNCPDRIEP